MIDLAIRLVGQAQVRAVPRRRSLQLRWLLGAVVITAAGFAWFSTTGMPARMDPDLVRVLQLMGFLKAGLVAAALAVLYWRLGWAMTPQLVGAYFAGVAMVVAASVWIWLANYVAIAGLLFHVGILVLAITALRDGKGTGFSGASGHEPRSSS